VSTITDVFLSDATDVDGIVFDAGASAFTITIDATDLPALPLEFWGVGITNNSGTMQNFVVAFLNGSAAGITFLNGTAGSLTAFTTIGGPSIDFFGTSTAGSATFTNNGGIISGFRGGETSFNDSSTADNGTFINNGAAITGPEGGLTKFRNTSTAGNATVIANGGVGEGGGGSIQFYNDSTGGTARMEVFGNGFLDISDHNPPGVTIGSIEGNGDVFLGANNLSVGNNNLSATFSGNIHDHGIGRGTGGSLTKLGRGKLTLSNASSYTGGTTVSEGILRVSNRTGSATGRGPVQVNAGTLAGRGIIEGAVTVGTGSSSGAIISPGNSGTVPGILTINNALTLNSLSEYRCVLNRSSLIAGEITALGVTINSGATFTFVDVGTGTLTVGTVLTVINNTSANPISGTFSNLPDGSVFTSNGNNFQASYSGGDGNDLALTVVP
jgi:autotransporter-associated beta strand protein